VAAYLVFWEPPAPVVSVSMSAVLRDAKNFPVDTAFGGSLTVADVGTLLVNFLADCEVSLELCLLRFCLSVWGGPESLGIFVLSP
jgi:hypothetical protein